MDIARLTWGHQIGHYENDRLSYRKPGTNPAAAGDEPRLSHMGGWLARSAQERVAVRRTRGDSVLLWWFVSVQRPLSAAVLCKALVRGRPACQAG